MVLSRAPLRAVVWPPAPSRRGASSPGPITPCGSRTSPPCAEGCADPSGLAKGPGSSVPSPAHLRARCPGGARDHPCSCRPTVLCWRERPRGWGAGVLGHYDEHLIARFDCVQPTKKKSLSTETPRMYFMLLKFPTSSGLTLPEQGSRTAEYLQKREPAWLACPLLKLHVE